MNDQLAGSPPRPLVLQLAQTSIPCPECGSANPQLVLGVLVEDKLPGLSAAPVIVGCMAPACRTEFTVPAAAVPAEALP